MKTSTLICLLALLFPLAHQLQAQENTSPGLNNKKGKFYFYWGYNRSFYSSSDLHFNGPIYDFTLYDVKGSDRPTDFSLDYVNPTTFTVPQYNYRMGYFITDRVAISGGIDHLKYVVDENQLTKISGIITPEASEKYQGSYLNQEIKLQPDLVQFEHTDGFNLVTIDLEYLLPLKVKLHPKLAFSWNFGLGGVWVVTRTNVKVLEVGLDNDFHIAGYTLSGKTGPRVEFNNRFFFLGEVRAGYASLPSVLIRNAEPELGDHNLSYVEYYFAAGVYFGFKKRKAKQL